VKPKNGNPILLFVALGLCILLGGFLILKYILVNSLHRADCTEIFGDFRHWVEAGSPSGEQLDAFMKGRRRDRIASNHVFSIENSNYTTQFVMTDLHSQRPGVLFVATNGVLIWLSESGRAKVVK
jgi:hypothetical protein